jgi:DNA uptake protein ComE-like DNA-binding protein
MHKLKAFIRLIFGFSQSESNAFLVLIPLMFAAVFSEPIYRAITLSGKPDVSTDYRLLDSLVTTFAWDHDSVLTIAPTVTLFPFDPNSTSEEDFVRLGISRKTASRIINYRSKGGKFRQRTDLRKIYGIDSSTYESLIPYIKLPDRYVYPKKDSQSFTRKRQKNEPLDLNLADSAAFQAVYGIGPVMAKRIISYRGKLGGFVNEKQLFEVWGLDSLVAGRLLDRSFVAADFVPFRININTAEEAEFASHPYIRWKAGKAIATWRFQHGPFTMIEDLMKISSIDEKVFMRIKPYLTLE